MPDQPNKDTKSHVLRPVDSDARNLGRELLRSRPVGALGTLDPVGGFPFTSLVTVATDYTGHPLILISELSTHTQALRLDPRCSLLLSQSGRGDALAHPRITLTTQAVFLERGSAPAAQSAQRFLARHEKAKLYAGFGDFSFVRLEIIRASLNGGFGKAYEMVPGDLLADPQMLTGLAEIEPSAIEHMNNDHGEAVNLFATKLCRQPESQWRLTGVDQHGIDLASDAGCARVAFDPPLQDAHELHARMIALAKQARAL